MPEQPLAERAFYAARPTIRVDAREHATVRELLVSMEMTEQEGGLSALELRLVNVASDAAGGAALAFEDDAVLRLGAAIAVHAGDEREPREIFRGLVTGLEADFPDDAAPSLVVLAEDVFQRARMRRRTQLHDGASIAALAERLAGELGLTARVDGLGDDLGPQVQLNESDLAFLRRLLARRDADLQVVGDELHVAPRPQVRRGTVELALHGQLRRARVLADLAHQVSGVTVRGWNPTDGVAARGDCREAALGPGRGRTGAGVLGATLGERPLHVSHVAVSSDAEARAVAEAAFAGTARRFVRVDATAEGNPAVRVGTNVSLRGLGPRFDNTYYVVGACHRFDLVRGYETDFTAECAYLGGGGTA